MNPEFTIAVAHRRHGARVASIIHPTDLSSELGRQLSIVLISLCSQPQASLIPVHLRCSYPAGPLTPKPMILSSCRATTMQATPRRLHTEFSARALMNVT